MSSQDRLLLEAPILRLPHEILRGSLKTQQKYIERDVQWMRGAAKQMADTNATLATVEQLDAILNRLDGLERKVCQACRSVRSGSSSTLSNAH